MVTIYIVFMKQHNKKLIVNLIHTNKSKHKNNSVIFIAFYIFVQYNKKEFALHPCEQQQEECKLNKLNVKYRDLVLLALFAAIVLVLGFTPLGFIPLVVIKATIVHIPVIIGSIVLGPKKGAILGALFGICSLITNTVSPALTSFVFTPFYPLPGQEHGSWLSLIICFVPRILVGIVPYFVYAGLLKLMKHNSKAEFVSLAVAGVCGSMVNTILVMGLIGLMFGDSYAAANNIASDALLGTIMFVVGTNGVAEAVIAGIITCVIAKVLLKLKRSQKQ